MINVFKIRKYGALLFASLFTSICFSIGMMFYGFLWGVGLMLIGAILSVLVGNLMLKNPFSDMLEGKGVLAVDINSTGILRFFIVGLDMPFIFGKIGKKKIRDIFNREAVANIAPAININPSIGKDENENDIVTNGVVRGKDGSITIKLNEESYNNSRMAALQYPCILYNSALGSVVTKNFISKQEKEIFAEHNILYLNRNVEELTSALKNFGRYVIDSLKPKGEGVFSNYATWIIIGFIILLVIIFSPYIIDSMTAAGGAALPAITKATSGALVAPMG